MWRALAALCLAGCATAVSEDQKMAAGEIHIACLRRAANQLDDGISDPLSVAVAIRGACATEEAQDLRTSGSGMSFEAFQYFQRKLEPYNQKMATTVVMQERQKRRRP